MPCHWSAAKHVQGLLLILDRSGVFRRLGDSPSRVAGQWVVDRGKRRTTASYQAEDSLGWPRHRMRVVHRIDSKHICLVMRALQVCKLRRYCASWFAWHEMAG